MLNCKTVATPINVNEKLQLDDGIEKADGSSFRSLVGGLIYLTLTRPDISFSVGVISRFMHRPSKHHLRAAKRILRYVIGTTGFELCYYLELKETTNNSVIFFRGRICCSSIFNIANIVSEKTTC
ncbi:uncharacterized mitochondrial protein AtMg00810-like [Nicotiana tomentosiformis]|uniref:uncharacterized mitochondrial protein AtMg00810-like n=1 Tax=Nicotiana tomentosiformis TaxID=4098 RepID=UPI00388CD3A0